MQYSLLEFAISLLIISLLISTTLFCYNVINSSYIKSFIFEINNLNDKVLLFHDRFTFVPGDYPFANQMWPLKCQSLQKKNNVLCDGDGNNYVDDVTEGFLALKHLSYAGLYYWHQSDDFIASYAKAGSNVASSYAIDSQIQILGDTKLHIANFNIEHLGKNFLRFAKARNYGNILDSVISPKHAFVIDNKIDDGFPLSGKVVADMGSREFKNENQQLCLEVNEKKIFFYRKFVSNIYCYLQVSLEN